MKNSGFWGPAFARPAAGRRPALRIQNFVKNALCVTPYSLPECGHPYILRGNFFCIRQYTLIFTWINVRVRIFEFVVLTFWVAAGRQPESVPREKNWNFLKCFYKKSWKTCATTYQRDLRVIKHQRLRKWYRHIRTSITFVHRYHFTFYTFKTLAC